MAKQAALFLLKRFINESFNTSTSALAKGDEQEKSRDRSYKRTRRFQGRIAGNKVMF